MELAYLWLNAFKKDRCISRSVIELEEAPVGVEILPE
jgi:hypothetical protein